MSRLSAAIITCVLGLPSPPDAAVAQPAPSPARTWLVLGDSYSSGEGIQNTATPSTDQRPRPGEQVRDCRRADGTGNNASAWAPTAYRRVGAELRISDMRLMACTGAITDEIPAQITEARTTFGVNKWDIVTLSIGGNNIKFADIIRECVDLPPSWRILVGREPGCRTSADQIRTRVDMLAGATGITQDQYNGFTSLPSTYENIADHVNPGGHVIVLGYPNIIEDADRWPPLRAPFGIIKLRRNRCEMIWRKDVQLLRTSAAYLNQRIQDAVLEADRKFESRGVRFDFLNISQSPYEDAAGRHGLCTADPWLHGVKIDRKLYIGKSFHPNQGGYDATGKTLADYLRGHVQPDDTVVSCPTVAFSPDSEDGAFEISSAGVPCGDVEAMLREIRAGPGFADSFHVREFDCQATDQPTEEMNSRFFRCADDRHWFTFTV